MLSRVGGYLFPREVPVPEASCQLEREGYAVLRGVLTPRQVGPIRNEIAGIYARRPRDGRAGVHDEDFRYEMFNKSPRAQKLAGRREILDVIEPLLGEDCQVHYARRDIAQRIKRTATVNHIDLDALGRIRSKRERRLLGLHPPGFYDG